MFRVAILGLILATPASAQTDRPAEPVDPCATIALDDLRAAARVLTAPQRADRELKRERERLRRSTDIQAMLSCLMNKGSEPHTLGRAN